MRVTDRMMFDRANTNIVSARDKVGAAMEEASTGRRVSHPGDDPTSAGLIIKSRQTLERLDAISKGATRVNDEMSYVDATLQTMGNVLARARELTVQMSNDNYSAGERAGAGVEIDQLFRQVVMMLNTDVNGRYVFGGTADGAPPFDPAGNYVGDTGVRQLEVAPGILEDASIRADVAFKGVGGGVDIFAVLGSLRTALTSNNGNAVRGALPDLDTATRQLTDAMAKVGSMMGAFDVAHSVAEAGKVDTMISLTHEQDADVFESATKLALANHALEIALTASAGGFKMSLINTLG